MINTLPAGAGSKHLLFHSLSYIYIYKPEFYIFYWNTSMLIDILTSSSPSQRTTIVARELSCYVIDIARSTSLIMVKSKNMLMISHSPYVAAK